MAIQKYNRWNRNDDGLAWPGTNWDLQLCSTMEDVVYGGMRVKCLNLLRNLKISLQIQKLPFQSNQIMSFLWYFNYFSVNGFQSVNSTALNIFDLQIVIYIQFRTLSVASVRLLISKSNMSQYQFKDWSNEFVENVIE